MNGLMFVIDLGYHNSKNMDSDEVGRYNSS